MTLPNIKNSLALCALLRTIDSFRLFDKVNLLTGGGPANSTSTITQYLYNYGIKSLDFGFGSAGAIVMTVLVLAAFQCVHQTCDFVSAYGREEVNSYFCKCGLRRGHSSGKPGSLQA